jgi:peroxiredoxin Q/BCP
LAQLRQDVDLFEQSGAKILVLGPDGPNAFKRYWEENSMPFIGMADIRSKVADLFYQEVNWLKLGRMPALFVIDRAGMIRYAHYGDSMADIPSNQDVLAVLNELKKEAK